MPTTPATNHPPGATRRGLGPAAVFVTGALLVLAAFVIPTSAGAMSVGPGTSASVQNTPYSSDSGGCDPSRDGWHLIMNGIEHGSGELTGSDFGPVTLTFSNGSSGSAVFTDASSKTAHFLDATTNQSGGPFTITSASMTFPGGTTVTSFNNFVVSHPPCGSVPTSTTSTTADTTTSTAESTTTSNPVSTETTSTTLDTTTTTAESTTTTADSTTTSNPVSTETTSTTLDTTTTTNPVSTETTSTTLDTTTTTNPVSTETTSTTSPVSTETTNTTTPVSTVPTTPVTVRPGEPVFIERQVENAVATPYAVTTSELPRTGGPDGGPFIVAGLGLMAAGGGLWLLQRRRTST